MKILFIVGSLRKQSYNMRIVKTIQERCKGKFEMEIADIGALPHFNQDDELDPQASVKAFKKQVTEADGVLIVTPEYNWSVPGVLKNAIDWASRGDKVFIGKPVHVIGAVTGMLGTIRAQLDLRQILASTGVAARLLPPAGNEVLISQAEGKFDESGLIDQPTLTLLDGVMDRFINWIKA